MAIIGNQTNSHCTTKIMEKVSSSLKNLPKVSSDADVDKISLQHSLQKKRKHNKKRFNNHRIISRRYNLRRRSDAYSNPFRKNEDFNELYDIEEDYLDKIIRDSAMVAAAEKISHNQKVVDDGESLVEQTTKTVVKDLNNNLTLAVEPKPVSENIFEEILPKENSNMIKTTVIPECSNLLENVITSTVAGQICGQVEEKDGLFNASTKSSFLYPLTINTSIAEHTKSTNEAISDNEMQVNTDNELTTQNKENDPLLSPTF